jgi:hypothetical protein
MKLEIPKGYNIYAAAQMAINEAQHIKDRVEFEFNSVVLNAHPQSYAGDIAEIYNLKHKILCDSYKFG